MHRWQNGGISIRCTCFSSTNSHRTRGEKGGREKGKGGREKEGESRRRVSNLFPWGPNPSVERRKQTETDGRGKRDSATERQGKRRIYVFGEGQGNEGSDKCSRVVQLDATGGKETRSPVTPALSKLISQRRMKIDLF